MRKIYFFILFLSSCPLFLLAQQRTIKGKVIDIQNRAALEGVSISVNDNSGRSTGVSSNASGNYSIVVPPTA
ncbi:MAG TPA: hypothetical protein VK625_23250, partial [Flavitalea sp.]|nr:hypothetical protein [Flavitalea sp.]